MQLFNINRIYAYQAHDEIESILEISFTLAFIFLTSHDIWNAGKERSQPCTEVLNLSILQLKSCISNPWVDALTSIEIVAGHKRKKAFLYLVIWIIQKKNITAQIKILYSKIATLINHRQRLFYGSFIVDKFFSRIIAPRYLVHILIGVRKQTDEIGRCSALEPIVRDIQSCKSIKQAEWIINISHVLTEMITIIVGLKHWTHLIVWAFVSARHFFYRFTEYCIQFCLWYTTKSFILAVHTYIKRLIETTEYTDLRKLGNSSKKDKLKMLISTFEHRIETFQCIAMLFLKIFVHVKNIKNRLVVFVYQNNGTAPALLMGSTNKLSKQVAQTKLFSSFR